MNITNNFFIVIFALIPIILYVFLVYYMIPKSFVSLDRGRRYLISGLMSPFLIFLVYFIFPNWGKQLNVNFLFDYVFFTVIQIGLLEEFSKYSIFQWVSSERISRKHDLPIATLYYSLMTSLGFALSKTWLIWKTYCSKLICHHPNQQKPSSSECNTSRDGLSSHSYDTPYPWSIPYYKKTRMRCV